MPGRRFLAVYLGSEAAFAKSGWHEMTEAARKKRQQKGVKAWEAWGVKHAQSIVEQGTPIGKTRRVDAAGVSSIKNAITGYVVVEAESHEAAARLFEDHPHFTIFPGDGVEVMECLDLAEMLARSK
ncbi:MAG: hypothetical protein K2X43_21170 [Hyphomonadaceae bacterium]|jgi:transcription antitermination factor NusG|nr:hypothetical protein [Hyphomonadaceae bacterium]